MNAREVCDVILANARGGKNRQCRLLLCAICRQANIFPTLTIAAEDYADGHLTRAEMDAVFRRWAPSLREPHDFLAGRLAADRQDSNWVDVLWAVKQLGVAEGVFLHLTLDVFPEVLPTSSWRPSNQARNLAHAAYKERLPSGDMDPSYLAVLADCLEEESCPDPEWVCHLRGEKLTRCPSCGGRGTLSGPGTGRLPLSRGEICDPLQIRQSENQDPRTCRRCNGSGRMTVPLVIHRQGSVPAPHYRGCWAVERLLE